MKIEVKTYNSIASLVSSIIFLILGAIMYTNPDAVVVIVSRVLGGVIIISGAISCIKNYMDVKRDSDTTSSGMVLGIVAIVIGLVFILLAEVIEWLVRLVIGGWILFSGINRLINALYVDKKTSKFYVMLGIAILLIGGGLYTILEANLAFQAIGIILMIYAGLEIFGYIFNRKSMTEVTDFKVSKNDKKNPKGAVDAVVIEDKTEDKKKKKKKGSK